MPLSKMFEYKLKPTHERVLSVMKENKFLSLREIAKEVVKKYSTSPEVTRWKGRVGDVSRYQIARYLKTLEREGYVESNNKFPKKWNLLKRDSLLNEVIQGYVYEGRAKDRIEALKKLAERYVKDHTVEFQAYIDALRKAKRIDELKTREFEAVLLAAKSVLKKLESS